MYRYPCGSKKFMARDYTLTCWCQRPCVEDMFTLAELDTHGCVSVRFALYYLKWSQVLGMLSLLTVDYIYLIAYSLDVVACMWSILCVLCSYVFHVTRFWQVLPYPGLMQHTVSRTTSYCYPHFWAGATMIQMKAWKRHAFPWRDGSKPLNSCLMWPMASGLQTKYLTHAGLGAADQFRNPNLSFGWQCKRLACRG